MKKVCFHFPFYFSGFGPKKKDDGRVGAGKVKDADNIVSASQSVALELCVIDTRVWGHIWNASTANISDVSCRDDQRTNSLAIFLVSCIFLSSIQQKRKTVVNVLTFIYSVCMPPPKKKNYTAVPWARERLKSSLNICFYPFNSFSSGFCTYRSFPQLIASPLICSHQAAIRINPILLFECTESSKQCNNQQQIYVGSWAVLDIRW